LVGAAFPDCSSGISARPSSLIPISSSHRFAQRKNRACAIWIFPGPAVKANIDAAQAVTVTVTDARKIAFSMESPHSQ
jgi:hypothetical protein